MTIHFHYYYYYKVHNAPLYFAFNIFIVRLDFNQTQIDCRPSTIKFDTKSISLMHSKHYNPVITLTNTFKCNKRCIKWFLVCRKPTFIIVLYNFFGLTPLPIWFIKKFVLLLLFDRIDCTIFINLYKYNKSRQNSWVISNQQ